MKAKTSLKTFKASTYIAQLSGLLGKKINVRQTGANTKLIFPDATALLRSDGQMLFLEVEAETEAKLTEIKDIVGAHLERFAFRENLRVSWPNETIN